MSVGGSGVGVLVGAFGAVVNVLVELVVVLLPSLTVAYHSYCAPAVKPAQLAVALEPEATVVDPTTVKGLALSCML